MQPPWRALPASAIVIGMVALGTQGVGNIGAALTIGLAFVVVYLKSSSKQRAEQSTSCTFPVRKSTESPPSLHVPRECSMFQSMFSMCSCFGRDHDEDAEVTHVHISHGALRFQGHRPPSERKEGHDPRGFRFIDIPLPDVRSIVEKDEWDRLMVLRSSVEDLGVGDNAALLFRKDDITLLRYLRARRGDVNAAELQLRETFEWERLHDARNALVTWEPGPYLALRPYYKPFGVFGLDRDGDPVLYERGGCMDVDSVLGIAEPLFWRDEVFRRETLLGVLDEVAQQQGRPVFQFTVVEDLEGFGWDNLRFFQRFKQIDKVYSRHCPELVKRIIFVNTPSAFPAIWSLCSPILDEGTRQKAVVPPADQMLACLFKYIPEEAVPAYLGGLATTHGDPYCREVICPGGPIPDNVLTALNAEVPAQ